MAATKFLADILFPLWRAGWRPDTTQRRILAKSAGRLEETRNGFLTPVLTFARAERAG
jgi:hypothetical protein